MRLSEKEKKKKGGEGKNGGVFMRRERLSMAKAVGPKIQADLQRVFQRVRYLTQLALHSSLTASLSPPHLSSSLPFFHEVHSPLELPPPFFSVLPFRSLSPHFRSKSMPHSLHPWVFKRIKDKSGEGGGGGGAAKEGIRGELTQTRGKKKVRGLGRWWCWFFAVATAVQGLFSFSFKKSSSQRRRGEEREEEKREMSSTCFESVGWQWEGGERPQFGQDASH